MSDNLRKLDVNILKNKVTRHIKVMHFVFSKAQVY